MKKLVLLVPLIALAFTLTYCSTEDNSEDESIVLNAERQSGYDDWGFNFQAHNFNSYLVNAMIGDPAFAGMPHYRQPGLVYHGEGQVFWDNLVAEYPYFNDMMLPGLLDCKMEMKWNDALLDTNGIYPPTWNDTGAWIIFKYKMNSGDERWTHVRKLVSISTGDELIDGFWYNSEGQEIGMQSYYWADTLIIKQVVNNGENMYVPWAMPPDYVCPNSAGVGNL